MVALEKVGMEGRGGGRGEGRGRRRRGRGEGEGEKRERRGGGNWKRGDTMTEKASHTRTHSLPQYTVGSEEKH